MGKVKTAIPGLDELIEGGYVEYDETVMNDEISLFDAARKK